MIILTVNRVKNILSGAKTEIEVVSRLRSHKIKYTYTTETGFLTIKIPCKKGNIRVYRACSRSAPIRVYADRFPPSFAGPICRID